MCLVYAFAPYIIDTESNMVKGGQDIGTVIGRLVASSNGMPVRSCSYKAILGIIVCSGKVKKTLWIPAFLPRILRYWFACLTVLPLP
jgi:hypothetical protein